MMVVFVGAIRFFRGLWIRGIGVSSSESESESESDIQIISIPQSL